MANIPPARMPSAGGAGGGGGAAQALASALGVSVHIAEFIVQATAGAQTVTIPIADLRGAMASILEGVVAQRGAALGKAAT